MPPTAWYSGTTLSPLSAIRSEIDQDNLVALLRESSDARSNRTLNLVFVIDGWLRRSVLPEKTRSERSSPFQGLRCCKILHALAGAAVKRWSLFSETAG